MKLVVTTADSLAGERTVLRSPQQTLRAGALLTYRLSLIRDANDSLAAIDVYVVHRAHARQTANTAPAHRVLTWSRSVAARDWTVCVQGGTYWLEFRTTSGWNDAVYEVNRVHGGNDWAVACVAEEEEGNGGRFATYFFGVADF